MKICFGCFEQYDDSFDICPHCGYAEGTEPELATYMRPGAILNERYVIGRALGHGGFSVTYLAWDALLLHKVAIKEYLPSEYATRRPGESRLTIFSGKEGEYFSSARKNFWTRTAPVRIPERGRHRPRLRLLLRKRNGLSRDGISRRHHAERVSEKGSRRFAAGRLAPEKAAISMLTPVMLSLQRVHDSGMIHRDIAPDNIMLLKDGGVRLIDFRRCAPRGPRLRQEA
ncbi:MAG: protein kinase domain-containing protein [Acutalibacteraceae bacterium]